MILDHTSFEAESLGGNQGTERQECLVCKPSHLCVFCSRHASGCSRSGALICIIRRVRSRNLSINHTHALSFRKSGDPEPGLRWAATTLQREALRLGVRAEGPRHRGIAWRRESCSVVNPNHLILSYQLKRCGWVITEECHARWRCVKPNHLI